MNIPDKAVEAAAKAIYGSTDGVNADMLYDHEAEWFAKAALRAAAPFIAAQVLRDFADWQEVDVDEWSKYAGHELALAERQIICATARARADHLEAGK